MRAGEIRQPGASPWCEARSSQVHGRGVFATRDIPAGTRIMEYGGEIITKKEAEKRGAAQLELALRTGDASVYIFILDERYDIDGSFEWNSARLVNHSCAPNCETEICEETRIWVVALRDIAKGEELFYDYHFDMDSFEDHPCRCGAPDCLGYIVSRDHWEEVKNKMAAAAGKS